MIKGKQTPRTFLKELSVLMGMFMSDVLQGWEGRWGSELKNKGFFKDFKDFFEQSLIGILRNFSKMMSCSISQNIM